jgi:hypothetical protein
MRLFGIWRRGRRRNTDDPGFPLHTGPAFHFTGCADGVLPDIGHGPDIILLGIETVFLCGHAATGAIRDDIAELTPISGYPRWETTEEESVDYTGNHGWA